MLRYLTIGIGLILFSISWAIYAPVEASQPASVCVPLADENPSLNLNIDPTDNNSAGTIAWGAMVMDYLNGGGDPSLFETALMTASETFEADFIYENDDPRDYWRGKVFMSHLLGDEADELVVDLSLGKTFSEGTIFVFECVDDQYQSHLVGSYAMPLDPIVALETGAIAVQDFTGNGVSEILLHAITNVAGGGHSQAYFVMGWDEDSESFVMMSPVQDAQLNPEVITAASSEMTTLNGDIQLQDVDGDALDEIIISQPPYRSSDVEGWSRLDRPQETIWDGLDDGADSHIVMVCHYRTEPAQYRIQALEDATDAVQCGDVEMAIELTEAALSDESLMFWTVGDNACGGCDPELHDLAAGMIAMRQEAIDDAAAEQGDPPPNDVWEAELEAYATFRLAILYDAIGDDETADNMQSDLDENFPDSGFQDLINLFRNMAAESDTPDYAAICAEVNAAAAEQNILSPFPKYYYGQFIYGIEEPICPF